MSDLVDIKGMWEGSYSYSSTVELGATDFKARLSVNDAGDVTGLVIEEDVRGMGQIKAELSGTIEGRTIRLTKRYVDGGEEYNRLVEYEGTIAVDGQLIEGLWKLPDDSGTFSMRRPA